MKYNKPEVTKLDNAFSAIQDQNEKPGVLTNDGIQPFSLGTQAAYQADE